MASKPTGVAATPPPKASVASSSPAPTPTGIAPTSPATAASSTASPASKEKEKEKESSASKDKKKPASSAAAPDDDADTFRRKKDPRAAATSILRKPELAAADASARELNDSAALAAVTVPRGIGAALDSFWQPFGAPIYNNLASIVRAARTINATTPNLEFVVLGWLGHGKSSLVEALLGLPVYQPGHTTLRPVHFVVAQNATLKTARYALGLETGIRHTTLAALPGELATLNASFSTTPVHVLIERPACVNMVIIDTPGLGGDDAVAKKAETLVASMSSPQRRYLCVEAAAASWQPSLLRAVVSALDPPGSHTTFVYTMAHVQLRNFVTHEQTLRYLRLCPARNAVFVETLSRGARAVTTDVDTYRQRIVQAQQRMSDACKGVGVAAAEHQIGLKVLLDEMHRLGVLHLEHQMPAILEQHRAQTASLRQQLATVMLEQDSLEPHLLRSAATRWAGSFGRALTDAFSGTVAGAGQTLEEERAASGVAWSTAPGSPVDVRAGDVEEARMHLLGVQQLHRLTHEFRQACAKIALTAAQVSKDDVAAVTAAGPPSAYGRALAASEIASRHAIKLYGPLVVQLFDRALSIVNRLPDVAFDAAVREGGFDGRRLTSASVVPRPAYEYADANAAAAAAAVAAAGGENEHEPTVNVQDFPFLLFRVRDALTTAARQFAVDAHRKCADELRCFFVERVPESEKLSVPELAHVLFDRMSLRVIENIVLKFQCFFVNRCIGELGNAVYSSIAVMPDAEVVTVFRTDDYRERLNARLAVLRIQMRRVAESQDQLESRLVQSADPTIRKSFIIPRQKEKKDDAAADAAPKKEPGVVEVVKRDVKPAAAAAEKTAPTTAAAAAPLVSPRVPVSKPPVPSSKAPPPPATKATFVPEEASDEGSEDGSGSGSGSGELDDIDELDK